MHAINMSTTKVIRVGIMPRNAMRDYTLAIARGHHKPKADEPKVWFTSMKSFAEVLSDENREQLRIILDRKPESLSELERLTGRRAVRPVAMVRAVRLDVDVAGGVPGRGRLTSPDGQWAAA